MTPLFWPAKDAPKIFYEKLDGGKGRCIGRAEMPTHLGHAQSTGTSLPFQFGKLANTGEVSAWAAKYQRKTLL